MKRSSLKLENCAKLVPIFCGPFEVLDKIGLIEYRIAFPTNMRAHNVFHVSLLKKYVHDPNHIVNWNVTQVELDWKLYGSWKRLCEKHTHFCLVLWTPRMV